MKLVTNDNNFCRVFELPDNYPNEYCFGGGVPVYFKMVDWFNPIPPEHIEDKILKWEEYIPMLKDFLVLKNYVHPGKKYLLLTDFNESMIFEKE